VDGRDLGAPGGRARSDYEHPFDEVDGAMAEVFETFSVWRAYVDRSGSTISSTLAGPVGRQARDRVVDEPAAADGVGGPQLHRRDRQRRRPHDGDPVCSRHIGNAHKQQVNVLDDDPNSPSYREKMHVIAKDRTDSPRTRSTVPVASVLSWEARGDAIAAGAQPLEPIAVWVAR
jgi:hypothetical protein